MEINEVAIGYLAHRARTEKEMRDYLIKKGFEADEVDGEILRLKERRYIDDTAYAQIYLRYALSKRKAVYKIRKELEIKGVSGFDIEDGIYAYEQENNVDITRVEWENAQKEAERVLAGKDHSEKKNREKLARRLNYLGYPIGTITKILQNQDKEW